MEKPQVEVLVLNPWKMLFWGIGLGISLSLLFALLTPWYRGWLRLEEAKTEVRVQQVLKGGCPQ